MVLRPKHTRLHSALQNTSSRFKSLPWIRTSIKNYCDNTLMIIWSTPWTVTRAEYTSIKQCSFASLAKGCVFTSLVAVSIAFWAFKRRYERVGSHWIPLCVTLSLGLLISPLRVLPCMRHRNWCDCPFALLPFPCKKNKATPGGCLPGPLKSLHYCHSYQR